ncbi:MAG: dienelactone hydrolase family protein [bacterium]|nr:dienelactone hydrolase family protein [bacterium]
MPVYDPSQIEYAITSEIIDVVMDDGSTIPGYWAHPSLGAKFPGVALVHDWWGVTPLVRRLANLIAQMGYHVIVPDLFNGQVATTPQQAMTLVQRLGDDNGYPRVHNALSVLERRHNCNGAVAAIGLGMGGSLAFEAALTRDDLEAAVAFGGFPHRYWGRFKDARAPILAFYGDGEPHIVPAAIRKLQTELTGSSLPHRVEIIPSTAHDFFFDHPTEMQRNAERMALRTMFSFLTEHLKRPIKAPSRRR